MKETLSDAAKSTSTKLQEVWSKANIPVKMEENIRAGIQKLYKEYRNLGKEKSRNTDKANVKRQIWKGDLVELFDISWQNVMDMTSISQEDKEFLRSQRGDRMSSSMIGVDKVFVSKIRTKCTKEDKMIHIRINITNLSLKSIRQLYWKTHLHHHQHLVMKRSSFCLQQRKNYIQVLD